MTTGVLNGGIKIDPKRQSSYYKDTHKKHTQFMDTAELVLDPYSGALRSLLAGSCVRPCRVAASQNPGGSTGPKNVLNT